MSADSVSGSNARNASRRAASPIAWRSAAGMASNRCRASANATGSSPAACNPVTPSVTYWAGPPASPTTPEMPISITSGTTRPNGSGSMLQCTPMSTPDRNSLMSFWWPGNSNRSSTFSSAASERISSRYSGSPAGGEPAMTGRKFVTPRRASSATARTKTC